jgi:type IV secretory pathway VirB2 component (pilin)
MKKATKIIAVVLIMLTLVLGISTISSADSVDPGQIANGLHGTTSDAQEDITGIGNQIIGIITTVGVVVAVVILLVLGIKYMMGSASEKAEYKKTMIPYLVGAILIFGASAITQVVVNIASGLND